MHYITAELLRAGGRKADFIPQHAEGSNLQHTMIALFAINKRNTECQCTLSDNAIFQHISCISLSKIGRMLKRLQNVYGKKKYRSKQRQGEGAAVPGCAGTLYKESV